MTSQHGANFGRGDIGIIRECQQGLSPISAVSTGPFGSAHTGRPANGLPVPALRLRQTPVSSIAIFFSERLVVLCFIQQPWRVRRVISRNIVVVNYERHRGIAEGFRSLGFEVFEDVDWVDGLNPGDVLLYLNSMYRAIKSPLGSLALKARFNRAGVPVISWNRDGPANKGDKAWRLWLLRRGIFMDIYATHTLQGSHSFAGETLYLPNAAWHTNYHLGDRTLEMLRDPSTYLRDVSFFGRADPERYPEMRERYQFLVALRERLSRLKVSCEFTDKNMTYAEQRDYIQTSRINLNCWAGADTCYHGGYKGQEKSWGLPERCYGVQACGGFLISDHRKHAADDFRLGSEWIEFTDLDECVSQITRFLANFDQARDIAEAAHRRVMREHTYINRASTLRTAADRWRAEREKL